ncbi:MAG TPA: FkbM family methyltransferase [Magnetococcales bacterium]|nr:FkbM family methyltransferase [Magnetococcales bacterium]
MNQEHPGLTKAKRLVKQLLGRDMWIWPQVRVKTDFLGGHYGGYAVFPERLNRGSVIYSVGLGENISFDLALIERYGSTIFACDPTPKSVAWLRQQNLPEQFKFRAIGLAAYDGVADFASPRLARNVSFSMARHASDQETGVTAEVACLATLMRQNGHDHLDILKMDVEGAEYDILENVMASHCSIGQIILEFHPEMVPHGLQRTKEILKKLYQFGYRIYAISADGRDFSLMHTR